MQELTYDLNLEETNLIDVLRALLHTVIFQRRFTVIKPKEARCECANVSYVKVDDNEADQLVEEKLEELAQYLKENPASLAELSVDGDNFLPLQVSIKFYERSSKRYIFFGKVEDLIVWENWIFNLRVRPNAVQGYEPDVHRTKLKHNLQTLLMSIAVTAVEKREHIPLVTSSDRNPFPFQISVPSTNENSHLFGQILHRLGI